MTKPRRQRELQLDRHPVVVYGGWGHRTDGGRALALNIEDPVSHTLIAQIEIEPEAVLDFLSNTHRSAVGGTINIFPLDLIGKVQERLTVRIPIDKVGHGDSFVASVTPFVPEGWKTSETSYNSHLRFGDHYHLPAYRYVDPLEE